MTRSRMGRGVVTAQPYVRSLAQAIGEYLMAPFFRNSPGGVPTPAGRTGCWR